MIRSAGAPIDVLIHVADGVLHDGLDYAVRIEERLSAAGLKSARSDLTESVGEQLQPARAHVLTGGTTSVLSDAKWMRLAIDLARSLVAKADKGEHSVIGICLGSQILAESLRSGSIVPSGAIEVGLAEVEHSDLNRARQIVPSFHYESIRPEIAVRAGTKITSRNRHSPVQAFRYRKRTFAYQFHPELNANDLHNVIDYHEDLITRLGVDVSDAHSSIENRASTLSPDLFDRTVIDCI